MKILSSDKNLNAVIPNIGQMISNNANRFKGAMVFYQKKNEIYEGITWEQLFCNVKCIAANLRKYNFNKGDKMVIFSPNRIEMLEMELAVMSSGGIAVPIFANFKKETAELLIKHSEANFLAVAGEQQLNNISHELKLKYIFLFDNALDNRFKNLVPFESLLKQNEHDDSELNLNASPDEICLNMYTSGTTGVPKCVQLSHKNILSQQAALDIAWNVDEKDRFLSYLPWHHSFGGIFELFTVLSKGASMWLEPSYGKLPESIFENWKLIKPTIFFSVPKVYKALVELTKFSKNAEDIFFNSGLKFIFTAAAPLPYEVSEEFAKRKIPVIEGWGLTETSPCCTLTDPNIIRMTGVVGKPIPGVTIRIAEDNEIQVKGPNVMKSYYNNDVENEKIFTKDGWFRTGDIGEITPSGLKLITRQDRIFKLSNGEKVIPTELENLIEKKCHYISFALVTGNGREYPVALLFPNKKLFEHPTFEVTPNEGCFCPRNLFELQKCLHGCLNDANCIIGQKFSKVKAAALIDDELSLDNNTLTPSLKPVPKNVIEAYRKQLNNLYGEAGVPMEDDIYIIKLDNKNKIGRKF